MRDSQPEDRYENEPPKDYDEEDELMARLGKPIPACVVVAKFIILFSVAVILGRSFGIGVASVFAIFW